MLLSQLAAFLLMISGLAYLMKTVFKGALKSALRELEQERNRPPVVGD